MRRKKMSIVFVSALVALSPLSVEAAQSCDDNGDCTSPDVCISGACVPPVLDPDAYVTEAMTRWSSYVWVVQFPALFEPDPEVCCFDFTGDGHPDDGYGVLVGLMKSGGFGFEPVLLMVSAIENGETVKVFDWRELAADLATGDVQVSIFDGQWTDSTSHQDRILGLGHTAFQRLSFGPYGAYDQLNTGIVTSGFVDIGGDQITLDLPWPWPVTGLVPLQLQESKLEAFVSYGELQRDACLGLCSVDEDRGTGHDPQIVGGARLGGVIRAEEILTRMDDFYRECSCAAPPGTTLSIEWQENIVNQAFEIHCPVEPLAPDDFGYACLDGDPCGDMHTACDFLPILGPTLDVDLDGTGINESWSIGLRIGFAGTTLDPIPELFADGFEYGDTSAWDSNSLKTLLDP